VPSGGASAIKSKSTSADDSGAGLRPRRRANVSTSRPRRVSKLVPCERHRPSRSDCGFPIAMRERRSSGPVRGSSACSASRCEQAARSGCCSEQNATSRYRSRCQVTPGCGAFGVRCVFQHDAVTYPLLRAHGAASACAARPIVEGFVLPGGGADPRSVLVVDPPSADRLTSLGLMGGLGCRRASHSSVGERAAVRCPRSGRRRRRLR
jgi:hypothetical protein